MSKLKCHNCHRSQNKKHIPFCSDVCKMVDLSKWFDGSFYIPAREDENYAILDEGGE